VLQNKNGLADGSRGLGKGGKRSKKKETLAERDMWEKRWVHREKGRWLAKTTGHPQDRESGKWGGRSEKKFLPPLFKRE